MVKTLPERDIPDLFRGDSCLALGANAADRGKTFADHFLTNGLMAKFADWGDLGWEHLPLPYLVAAHVGYLKSKPKEKPTLEERISFRSPMLSFSQSLEEAWYFVDRTEKKKFEVVGFTDATHFVWKLSGITASEVSTGRWRFSYRYSTENVEAFRRQLEADLLAGKYDKFARTVATGIVHDHLQRDREDHQAELIEVVPFLEANRASMENQLLWEQATERARRSREWLLYPRDPMEDGRGFSAQFGPNRFLSVPVFARVAQAKSPATV